MSDAPRRTSTGATAIYFAAVFAGFALVPLSGEAVKKMQSGAFVTENSEGISIWGGSFCR